MARKSIHDLLREARARLVRLEPHEAHDAFEKGALLVDIRSEEQQRADGSIPGALGIPRNVLEWMLDPDSDHQHPDVGSTDRQIVLICAEGYQSSLACGVLHQLGFARATDVIGGFAAWRDAGLPISHAAAEG